MIEASGAFGEALAGVSYCVSPDDKILVAISGGADSTALLAWAVCYAEDRSLELHACHVNHNLRGLESDEDENFCKELCSRWGVTLHVERVTSEDLSGKRTGECQISEAQLRDLRYKYLESIASKIGALLCMTGHTMDDQVETLLFRLFRGTGPTGMLGIKAVRKFSDKLQIIRPLLYIRRLDCQNFLERIGISARSDSSNADNGYSRNFIRNEIIPLIEKRFGGFVDRVENLRKLMEGDEQLLQCLSRDAYSNLREGTDSPLVWNLDEFNELPLSLRRRVIYDALKDQRIDYDYARIESLLELIDVDGAGALSLNEFWELRVADGLIRWRRRGLKSVGDERPVDFSMGLKEGSNMLLRLGLSLRLEKVDIPYDAICFPESCEMTIMANLNSIDFAELKLRHRQPGDQIQPLGMSQPVRLKKFLHTHKSTQTLSFGGRALVLSDNSEVLWVPGCGISQKIAVRDRATHRITVNRIAPDPVSYC